MLFFSNLTTIPPVMTLVLEAVKRESGIRPKAVRAAGRIPAVYYGQGRPSFSLQLDYQAFRKIFEQAGENTVIELSMDGKRYPVLVHDVQLDPVTDNFAHIDFIHVDMQKEVITSVKINVVGEAPAVKNLGGILNILKKEIKIKCLPRDLIKSVDVDVSEIADFSTVVRVGDLKIPPVIQVLDKPDSAVATVVAVKAEEEEKPAEAAATAVTEGEAKEGKEGEAAPRASEGIKTEVKAKTEEKKS